MIHNSCKPAVPRLGTPVVAPAPSHTFSSAFSPKRAGLPPGDQRLSLHLLGTVSNRCSVTCDEPCHSSGKPGSGDAALRCSQRHSRSLPSQRLPPPFPRESCCHSWAATRSDRTANSSNLCCGYSLENERLSYSLYPHITLTPLCLQLQLLLQETVEASSYNAWKGCVKYTPNYVGRCFHCTEKWCFMSRANAKRGNSESFGIILYVW